MTASTIVAAAASSRSALGVHAWHAVEAVGFLVVSLVGVSVSERLRRRPEPTAAAATSPSHRRFSTSRRSSTSGSVALVIMAISGAGAAAVHYVVMPEHFREAALYGAFFLIAATAQLGYSVLLVVRPSRPLIAVGMVGNFSMVALWLATRLIAIPLGPAAGSTESFGGVDILASSFETVVVIAGLLGLVQAAGPGVDADRGMVRRPVRRPRPAAAADRRTPATRPGSAASRPAAAATRSAAASRLGRPWSEG